MNVDLNPVVATLAYISVTELRALIDATYKAPQVAPGLLAWLDAACEWELNRRQGHDNELQPPEAAMAPEEDAISIDAAIATQATLAQDSTAVGAPCSARWRSSTYRVECPKLRHRMSAYRRNDGLQRVELRPTTIKQLAFRLDGR